MKPKKSIGWTIGVVLAGAICLFMLVVFLGALSETGDNNSPKMGVEEMSAHCYRASELFCASIFYTDKALSADPQAMDYGTWEEYVERAFEYIEALEYELDLIYGYADTEGFQEAFEDTEIKNSFYNRLIEIIVPTAYAIDTREVLRAYNGAKAGKELQAVADYLGKDIAYAKSALKVAKGEIDAQKWNNVADTMYALEAAARVAKTAAQTTALVVGGPATGVLASTALVVNGASLIWQATDDVCFIAMGDKYDSSEFVASLGKVSDFVAPVAFTGSMLTMNFTGKDIDKVLSSYTFADTLRGVLQDGKVAGIQLNGPDGNVISMTKDELLEYQKAKENGQDLPREIEALLKVLDSSGQEKELPEINLAADKTTALIEEWVTFTVQNADPDNTYVWEYGNNENPQDSESFRYMYQKAGNYTMYVTVLDAEGEPVGRGSCDVNVVDMPTATPGTTPEPTQAGNEDSILQGEFFGEVYFDNSEASGYRYTRITFDGNGSCSYEEYKETYKQAVVREGSESNYDYVYHGTYDIEEKNYSAQPDLKYVVNIYYTDNDGNEMTLNQYVYDVDMDGDKIVSFWKGDLPKVN